MAAGAQRGDVNTSVGKDFPNRDAVKEAQP